MSLWNYENLRISFLTVLFSIEESLRFYVFICLNVNTEYLQNSMYTFINTHAVSFYTYYYNEYSELNSMIPNNSHELAISEAKNYAHIIIRVIECM